MEAVNQLIEDVTGPSIEVSRVLDAVARGDLSQHLSLELEGEPLRGEFRRSRETVNTMVDQLNAFASEVTRVAREVGTEGKLGGQAEVPGVAGTWKDLTDSVNSMAGNLTGQVRNIAEVTTAVAKGDLSKKITVDVRGEILELKDTINTMVDQLNAFASEVTRVAREVGTEGKLGGQADVRGVGGTWKDLTDNVNFMAGNLTNQVRNIADVTTAVAKGDLSRKITVQAEGEIAELKGTVNTMVDQLNALASEVTRVAHEVGTDGKLGGQAEVAGVAGIWKDLTDNINTMSRNLTARARNIGEVTTAVANGDLSKKITVDVKGEFLDQKNTINTMVDQLNAFASEVTRVAREVGTEGKLGGQAGGAGRGGHLEGPHREREPARGEPDEPGARDRRGCHRRDQGRPLPGHRGGCRRRGRSAQGRHQRDDPEAARHDAREQGTGLAQDERGALQPAPPGPAQPGDRRPARPDGAGPLIGVQHGALYLVDRDKTGERYVAAAAYAAPEVVDQAALANGLVGQCARDRQRILLTRRPVRLYRDHVRPRERHAQLDRAPTGRRRGPDPGGAGARLVLRSQPRAPRVPRPARRDPRVSRSARSTPAAERKSCCVPRPPAPKPRRASRACVRSSTSCRRGS